MESMGKAIALYQSCLDGDTQEESVEFLMEIIRNRLGKYIIYTHSLMCIVIGKRDFISLSFFWKGLGDCYNHEYTMISVLN